MDQGSPPPDEKPLKDQRIFRSARYLLELEKGLYGTHFDILLEYFDKEKRRPQREKIRTLGPVALYRECETEDERVKPDLRTVHPTEQRELLLKQIS